MQAAVVEALGQRPQYARFPEPVASNGELLLTVQAAALKPLDRRIVSGKHYIRPTQLPLVAGVDGVGRTADGERYFFFMPRAPYGAMAERTVVAQANCLAVPGGVSDVTAAALFNPGMAAWIPLTWRGRLQAGETVLVLGATGAAGRVAVQIARELGAKRVIAAGRNPRSLAALKALGATATVQLDAPGQDLSEVFESYITSGGIDVVIDYLFGPPAQAFLQAQARHAHGDPGASIRFVHVGESAGSQLAVPGPLLRGAGLEISGTGYGTNPPAVEAQAFRELMARAADGRLTIATEEQPLAAVADVWDREPAEGVRVVFRP